MSDSAKLRIVYGILLFIAGLLCFAFSIVSLMLVIFSIFPTQQGLAGLVLSLVVAVICFVFSGIKFYDAGKKA